MDEHVAAIIVALVTGFFGLLGIIATNWVANRKAKKLVGSNEVKAAALVGESELPREDYFAAIRTDLRMNGMVAREGIQEIKECISDVKITLKEHATEDRIQLEALEARVARLYRLLE